MNMDARDLLPSTLLHCTRYLIDVKLLASKCIVAHATHREHHKYSLVLWHLHILRISQSLRFQAYSLTRLNGRPLTTGYKIA